MPEESLALVRLRDLLDWRSDEMRAAWALGIAVFAVVVIGTCLALLPTRDGQARSVPPSWSGVGEDVEDAGLVSLMIRLGAGLLVGLAAIFIVAATFIPASDDRAQQTPSTAVRPGDLLAALNLPRFEEPLAPEPLLVVVVVDPPERTEPTQVVVAVDRVVETQSCPPPPVPPRPHLHRPVCPLGRAR